MRGDDKWSLHMKIQFGVTIIGSLHDCQCLNVVQVMDEGESTLHFLRPNQEAGINTIEEVMSVNDGHVVGVAG
jgi:hypothetical protein